MSDKVLIVGWDGAPFPIIKEWIDDGHLPTLEGLANDGYFGPLETVPYVMSSCAWSTFLSGKNAGKHGIYDFYANEFKDGTYFRSPVNATARDTLDIRDYLNNQGRKIGMVNVPMTYPARAVDEFMVSGMLSPDPSSEGFCYPEDFLDDFEQLNEYQIDIEEREISGTEEFMETVGTVIEGRHKITLYSLEKSTDLDVFFTVFTCPDRLSHDHWHYLDESHPFRKNESEDDLKRYQNVILDTYKKLDQKLGDILESFEEKYGERPTTAVVSDHGMKSLNKVLHVNKWLSQNGYLTFNDGVEELGEDIEEKLNDNVEYIFGKVDWEETTAYSIGKRGGIYVNLGGREPRGSVPPEQYDEVVSNLKQDLQEVIDPDTGENIISEINTQTDLFFGNHTEEAPDILLELIEGYYPFGYAVELEKPNIISTNDWESMPFATSIEDGDGIVCLSGPDIKNAREGVEFRLRDFAPTLLYFFDQGIPEDVDGHPVTDVFTAEFNDTREIEYYEGVDRFDQFQGDDDDSEGQVKERLKDLGYL
jgi:predicted AlkP superfamily phosphohydrolase/phosphomutase